MQWNKLLPIPKTNAERFPEGFAFPGIAPERPEEFGPGLDPALMEMVQAVAEMELVETNGEWGRTA